MRAVYAVAALAVAATASCSGSASPDSSPTQRPDNAGTLVVHAYRISGPVANGRPVGRPTPLINVTIRLRAADGFIRSDTTNENGAARFIVAPGRYRAHVVYTCTGLASVNVRVQRQALIGTRLLCWGVG